MCYVTSYKGKRAFYCKTPSAVWKKYFSTWHNKTDNSLSQVILCKPCHLLKSSLHLLSRVFWRAGGVYVGLVSIVVAHQPFSLRCWTAKAQKKPRTEDVIYICQPSFTGTETEQTQNCDHKFCCTHKKCKRCLQWILQQTEASTSY